MSTALAAARAKTRGKCMLRDALDGYGADEYTLSEWNGLKKEAELDGKWKWKASVASATAAVKDRFDGDTVKNTLQTRFMDVETAMEAELHAQTDQTGGTVSTGITENDPGTCTWRDRIGGKIYCCANAVSSSTDGSSNIKGVCLWHTKECRHAEHQVDQSRAIDIPNSDGMCLHCYEATRRGTLQKTPPRVPATKTPGVAPADLHRDVKRDELLAVQRKGKWAKQATDRDSWNTKTLTAKSTCAWEKEHSEKSYIWRCRNRVVMHPTLRGAFLPFCGYHAPRCLQEYGSRSTKCSAIDRRNQFGLCRNHLEAQLSVLSFEARAACVLVDTEFDVPGIVECRTDRSEHPPKRHPLAPKEPPPGLGPTVDHTEDTLVAVKAVQSPVMWRMLARRIRTALVATLPDVSSIVSTIMDHPNVVSMIVKDVVWRIQFHRRAHVVAIRIQRIFRGKRARRRVRGVRNERAALERLRACRIIQRLARGYLGRVAARAEATAVLAAVPHLQRVVRGGLARMYCRRLRAAIRIQLNFRAHRQRNFAWAMREEIAYMRMLQRQADANYEAMQLQVLVFRRLRARRVLRAHVVRWRHRRMEAARLAAFRLQSLVSAIKIQRAWRRYQYYHQVKQRYTSAQYIQKRVRGWLTRHMWHSDPGVNFVTSHISARTGFYYGRTVLLALHSRSYAYPTRRVRMAAAVLILQRVFRGHCGRLHANMRWAAMLRRWEWLGISSTPSSDSMTLGHERYGFLLPSYHYHHERRLHMLPIQRGIKPTRGFAYEYQSILELIQDRDGKRAWSLAKEEAWRQQRSVLGSVNGKSKERKEAQHRRKEHDKKTLFDGTSMGCALYPVGTVVEIAITVKTGEAPRWYRARIIQVVDQRTEDRTIATAVTTVDVEYLERVISMRGVHLYRENRVVLARVRHLAVLASQQDKKTLTRRRPVGKRIKAAIMQLQSDIQDMQRDRFAMSHAVSWDNGAHRALPSVDAIVDRLRDEHVEHDLLRDQRDFVNFVFENSQMLRTKWLQVVDHVRYGTSTSPGVEVTRSPSMQAFYRAFEMDPTTPKKPEPMPERAKDIERRMAALGFLYEPSANVKEKKRIKKPTARPETTVAAFREAERNAPPPKRIMAAQDDTAMLTSPSTTPQDLHRLLYEFKTLPRERQRERIEQISTRNARSFVCGVPACGQCFSSKEAARLHQQEVHLHHDRLALATPLTDQYMHDYWPPQSPWSPCRDDAFRPMVGYFHCRHVGCEQREFRSRRELQHHRLHDHGQSNDDSMVASRSATSLGNKSPTQNPSPASLVWLGTYTICPTPQDPRLNLPSALVWRANEPLQCETHAKTVARPEYCRLCFLATRRVVFPLRLYGSVALPGSRDERKEDSDDDDDYVVFSTQDPTLCPVLRAQDLIHLEGDVCISKRKRIKRSKNPPVENEDSKRLVFLKIHALCRDVNHTNWALGYVFQPASSTVGERSDSFEVVLDASTMVAVALTDVRGAGMVHRCSHHVFFRNYVAKDDPQQLVRLKSPLPSAGQNLRPSYNVSTTLLQRFWRDGGEKDDECKDQRNASVPSLPTS